MRTLSLLRLAPRLRPLSSFFRPFRSYNTANVATAASSPIQQMYDALKRIPNVSASAANPAQCPHLQKCLSVMDDVTLTDVGLDGYILSSIEDSVCMSICSTKQFDISLFIVPAGLAMPLHDHPNMAVLTKLLRGEALCTSFTPLHPCPNPYPGHQEHGSIAEEPEDTFLSKGPFYRREVQAKNTHSPAWFLTPSSGNLHAIHALVPSQQRTTTASPVTGTDPVIMLDVLLPPYHQHSRPCRYYSATAHPIWIPAIPVAAAEGKGGERKEKREGEEKWRWKKWVIKEIEEPTEDLPYGVQYTGYVPAERVYLSV